MKWALILCNPNIRVMTDQVSQQLLHTGHHTPGPPRTRSPKGSLDRRSRAVSDFTLPSFNFRIHKKEEISGKLSFLIPVRIFQEYSPLSVVFQGLIHTGKPLIQEKVPSSIHPTFSLLTEKKKWRNNNYTVYSRTIGSDSFNRITSWWERAICCIIPVST